MKRRRRVTSGPLAAPVAPRDPKAGHSVNAISTDFTGGGATDETRRSGLVVLTGIVVLNAAAVDRRPTDPAKGLRSGVADEAASSLLELRDVGGGTARVAAAGIDSIRESQYDSNPYAPRSKVEYWVASEVWPKAT